MDYYRRFIEMSNKHKVISTWFYEKAKANQKLHHFSEEYLQTHAIKDLNEIDASDAVVLFGEQYDSSNTGGGRFIEAGYALGQQKPVVLIGGRETIFSYHPQVHHIEHLDELEWMLDQLEAVNG